MRGEEVTQGTLFSYVDLEERVPKDHPLRRMRLLVDGILASLSDEFAAWYSHTGRPSVAPEKRLRALLLQVLDTIRSERQLVEQLDYTSCSAGSSGSASMIRSGTARCSVPTVTDCCRKRWRVSSSTGCWPLPNGRAWSRMSISALMGR